MTVLTGNLQSVSGVPLGGPAWSRLAVQHLSRQVEGPWNSGSEQSSPDPED